MEAPACAKAMAQAAPMPRVINREPIRAHIGLHKRRGRGELGRNYLGNKYVPLVAPVMRTFRPAKSNRLGEGTAGVGSMASLNIESRTW